MNCPIRAPPKIFNKSKGIFDRLGKIRLGTAKIQIMGGTRIKTLSDDCLALTAVDQREYRNTALGRGSGELCDRLQTLWFGLADIDHRDHGTGRKKAGPEIVESARRMNPPSEGRNFCGQGITLVKRKQEQIPEFD